MSISNPISQGKFVEYTVLATLKGDGAALKEREASTPTLAVTTEERKPKIYGWLSHKIIFTKGVKIDNLKHRVGADVMKMQVRLLHQGAKEKRTWGI